MKEAGPVPSAKRIMLWLLGINFIAEMAIMLIFAAVFPAERHPVWEALIDATLLTIILTPCLIFGIVRPIRKIADFRARLLTHVYEGIESERRRLARELHDEVGQSLTSMLVRLGLARDSRSLDDVHAITDDLRKTGHDLHDDIRRLARGLHPRILEDLGLATALQRLCDEANVVHDLQVTFRSDQTSFRLSPAVELVIYRIAQESITNAVKHAQATRLEIVLRGDAGGVVLEVRDDGLGISAAPRARQDSQGLGIHGMRERASSVHGHLTVDSPPGGGTVVKLRVPQDGA